MTIGRPPVSTTTTCDAGGVARRRDQPDPGEQLEFAVDRHVLHAGRIDPLADGVVVLGACVLEFAALDVDRVAGEEVVAAAVVEVQVGVDDDVDAGEVEVLLVQRSEAGIHVGHRRVQLFDAGVDQHPPIRVVDDVDVDRHPLALDGQVGDEDRRDGDGVHALSDGAPLGNSSPASCTR